jgi:hypothetical protein
LHNDLVWSGPYKPNEEEPHNADENQEAASYHEPMPKRECLQQLNQSAHFFAFSPISIDRRMASLRPILSRFSDNARALK